MTASGYIVRRILWQFGIKRAKTRWQTANRELQILKEAEDLLGRAAWRDVADVEELTGEYWELKDIENQEGIIAAEIEKLRAENEAYEARIDQLTDDAQDVIDILVDKRQLVAQDIDSHVVEVEELREDGVAIRRRFEGLKTKYKVMKDEGSDEKQLAEVKSQLEDLRETFSECKTRAQEHNRTIETIERRLADMDDEIHEKQRELNRRIADVSLKISENSKLLADSIAKLGNYERYKSELQARIGLYLSANPNGSSALRKAAQRHSSLIAKINYFRRSIQYNQRLAKGA